MNQLEKFSVAVSITLSCASLLFAWHTLKNLPKKKRVCLPRRIILIRHGESEGNVKEDTYQSTPDPLVPLSEEGRRQCEELGKRLRDKIGTSPVWVYSSSYVRARETGMISLRYLKPEQVKYVREDPRLREQEFSGCFQMGPLSREERDQYSKFYYRWKTGESAADVYDRVSLFISAIWRDFSTEQFEDAMGDDGAVVIFTHGLTARIFLMSWLHWRHEEFDLSRNPPNCGILELERQGDNTWFALSQETRSILFDNTDHHPRRSCISFTSKLDRQPSWIETIGDELWFHRLAANQRDPIESVQDGITRRRKESLLERTRRASSLASVGEEIGEIQQLDDHLLSEQLRRTQMDI